MREMRLRWAIVATMGLVLVGCSDTGPTTADKPDFDPDAAFADVEKADVFSTYYTTIVRSLGLWDSTMPTTIDYPDWLHGYTLELTAGQTIRVTARAEDRSYLRFYGPAKRIDSSGTPRFGRALVRDTIRNANDVVTFDIEVESDGTYMIATGPKWVWSTTYSIDTECVGGCKTTCTEDATCAPEGGYCELRMCIRPPCPSFCEPTLAEGAQGCHRDEMCDAGLVCSGDTCTQPKIDSCETNDDCHADAFCGYLDPAGQVRACKARSKEGESCGGYVTPDYVKVCQEGLQCVGPHHIIADIPGHCGTTATVAEILEDPKSFDGRYVALNVFAEYGPLICTRRACLADEDGNPVMCCNTCSTPIELYDDRGGDGSGGLSLYEDGEGAACDGMDCDWEDHCTVEAGAYWMAGWVRAVVEHDTRLESTNRWEDWARNNADQ